MTRRFAIPAAVVAVVVSGTAAFATWTATGGGTGGAKATSLAAPATVSSPGTTSTSVTIKVNAGPSSGPAPTSYRVDRTAPTAATGVCTISAVGGTCTETGLASSTSYTYVVRSKLQNWVSSSSAGPVNATTQAPPDTTGPSISTTFPAASGSYAKVTGNNNWDGHCSAASGTNGVCGTATDASGVASVQLVLERTFTQKVGNVQTPFDECYDFAGTWSPKGTGTCSTVNATTSTSSGVTSWVKDLTFTQLTGSGSLGQGTQANYTLTVKATDSAAAANVSTANTTFTATK